MVGRRFGYGRSLAAALGVWLAGMSGAFASERYFTYTYEPETMPQGAAEFEQWVSLGAGRSAAAGQDGYNTWKFREELEYGVTDNYTAALYLNLQSENFEHPTTKDNTSTFEFEGISFENRLMLLNPAEHPVGLTLYLEPRYSGEEAELEEKLIVGQRMGDWKWALNLTHASEWADHLHELEGEAEVTFGLARELGKHWTVGLEFRNHNGLPEYQKWASSAFFLGPTVTYRQERWWVALTVLPQIYGKNRHGDPDGHASLVLDEHERVNARLVVGVSF